MVTLVFWFDSVCRNFCTAFQSMKNCEKVWPTFSFRWARSFIRISQQQKAFQWKRTDSAWALHSSVNLHSHNKNKKNLVIGIGTSRSEMGAMATIVMVAVAVAVTAPVEAVASKFITNWMSNKAKIVSQNGHNAWICWTLKNYTQKKEKATLGLKRLMLAYELKSMLVRVDDGSKFSVEWRKKQQTATMTMATSFCSKWNRLMQ